MPNFAWMPQGGWLDNLVAIITTVPFLYWYIRKWHLLMQLKKDGVAVTAHVIRKLGSTVLYQYPDGEGRLRRQRLTLEKDEAAGLQTGAPLPVLYAKHKPGFSCPADAVQSTLHKTKRNLFSFIGITALCFVLPLVVSLN